ncbi:MAG: hypothetical protein JXB85_03945 [Anaerolineales bacterium]|nr:hypothetical protein [Anaerolineales bacterium]
MPAIDLSRLKTQAARLVEHFDQPDDFLRRLHEYLDFYTNRTIRARQIAQRLSLPTYRTPRPVLRQIEAELAPLAEARPESALKLTNAMWNAGSLEARLLAARLLGMIPLAAAMPGIARIPDWLRGSTDREIREALLTDALVRIRKENPQAYLNLLEIWLRSPLSGMQVWGLQALIPVLKPDFENLPAVFRILRPTVEAAGPATQVELRACLAALGQVSPTETLYFLGEIIKSDPPPMLVRTLRRILTGLPEELQSGLREMLRAA